MNGYFRLPHFSGLRVDGPGARQFCQSQLTADLANLASDRWQPAAWCDNKGRCLMIILAGVDEEAVELILPANQSALVDKLKMYAIGHSVKFAPLSSVVGRFASDEQARSVPGPEPRALKLANADVDAAAEADQLLRWQALDMAASLPWLQPETAGRHLPQFLGLEENLGLSYRKGCYPGQEVIARVHYLGSVKYKLLGFVGEPPCRPVIAPGSDLYDATDAPVAEVLDCLLIDNQVRGLAVCKTTIEAGTILRCQEGAEAESVRMVLPSSLC